MADNNIHETDRNTKTARATQNPGREATAQRSWYSPNSSNRRGIAQLCRSLAGCLQKRRTKSTGKQTASIKALRVIRQAFVKTSKTSLKRPKSKWLQNRLVDATAYRKVDTQTFRYKLPYRTRLADSSENGLELPEAREAGKRTQRAGHRSVAKEGLAAYKKKPVEPAEPLYWSMKAVLCLPRQFAAPGHQRDKHLFNIVGREGIDFRRFLLSASLHNAIGWVCISLSRTATSGWMILRRLFRCCWNIFQKVLFWFLTARWFTVGQKEDCVSGFPCVSTLNGSRPMPLNLIRSNRSGITASTASLPIIFLTTYWNLKRPFLSL